jgi:parallel beta-helix repeat protein
MKKLLILTIVLSMLLIGMPTVAVADTYNVSPEDDVQEIIDAASPGDTIVFALGTYSLSTTINVNESLTLTSEDPYAETKPLLDGGGALDRIIYIDADDVTLDGLEVANGTEDLIRQSGAYVGTTVRNCVVHDSSGDEGIQLKNCTDCLVECNLVYDVAEDGISIAEGSHNSVIRNNEIHHVGSENGAIYVYESYDMTVECNYIHDTEASDGIKLYDNDPGNFVIANNLIVDNVWKEKKRSTDGNAIHIYKGRAGTYTVVHNTLDDNTATVTSQGNGILVCDAYQTSFVTTVSDNIVTNHNGFGIAGSCSPYGTIYTAIVNYSYNDLWQNALGATDGNPVDGGGNISADPMYNSDYTLGAGSPCTGAAHDGEDMGRLFGECGCGPPVVQVTIDIKPGSDPNSINRKSKGKIPVAILSSPHFDAPSEVDQGSLTFGRTGEEDSLAFCSPSLEDVNYDGYYDLVCHFYTQSAGFECDDEWGYLKGETVDDVPIEGSDSVRIVPCK